MIFPWVCVLKCVPNSNCCHRHLELYIFDVQKFPYLSKYIYRQSYFTDNRCCCEISCLEVCCKSFIRNSELKAEKDQQDHEDYLLIEVFVKISIWVLIEVFVTKSMPMGIYCGY